MYKVKYSRKKGITLIELIAVIPIAIIVLSVTFAFYKYSNKVYKQSVDKNINQQDVRAVAESVEKELRAASVISTDSTYFTTYITSHNTVAAYYSLSVVDAVVSGVTYKQLVKKTYTGTATTPATTPATYSYPTLTAPTTEKNFGSKITGFNFLATRTTLPINRGMLEFYVEDSTGGQKYSNNFEFMLDNLPTNTIPAGGPYTIIYYAKY